MREALAVEGASSSSSPASDPAQEFRNRRRSLAGDRHRPLYHFLAPCHWMNDPNGAFFWKGKYHLFYQHNPNGPFWGTIHWGHAVSVDLVHWEDLPIALAPSKDGPDKDGCWSGCVVDGDGVPTALYTGLDPQTVCLATSDDDDLRVWRKCAAPVIAGPPPDLALTGFPSLTGHPSPDFRDPYVWREGARWLLLIGAGRREGGGLALLYESDDLRHWRFLRPALAGVVGSDCNMWECPVLLRFAEGCVLLISPHPEAKHVYWVAAEWRDGALQERRRDKLDWGEYVYAPQCLEEPSAQRYLLWTWVKEGRSAQAQRAAGWSGTLSLPKECRLGQDGALTVVPAAELTALRTESRILEGATLTPGDADPFLGWGSDCLEIEAEFAFVEPGVCDLVLRASPDGAERTVITYDSADGTLRVDGSRSSLDPDVDHPTDAGPLPPDGQGVVRFRAFLDRSVLEVFVADRACVTQRLYPTRADSVGLSFRVRAGAVRVRRLAAWKLAAIWPEGAAPSAVVAG